MDTTPPAYTPSAAPLGPWQRAVKVFTAPREAFAGLAERPTSLFPLLVTLIGITVYTGVLYQPAIVPMQLAQMEESMARHDAPPEAVERAEQFMRGPIGTTIALTAAPVMGLIIQLITALLVLLGLNFILGGSLTFRQAWSLGLWSGLVTLVPALISIPISLATGRFPVHLGLGVLMPPEEAESRMAFLAGSFLDGLSPFAAWYLVVGALGGAAMSGKPWKSILGVFCGIYLVVILFFAGLGAISRPFGG